MLHQQELLIILAGGNVAFKTSSDETIEVTVPHGRANYSDLVSDSFVPIKAHAMALEGMMVSHATGSDICLISGPGSGVLDANRNAQT